MTKMKLNKVLLTGLLGIAVAIILSAFFVNHRISGNKTFYNTIISYVDSNYELLENFPYDEIERIKCSNDSAEIKTQRKEEVIKKYLGENTIVTGVEAYNENILQFYCRGSGFLDVGSYMGFYFSRDDTPCAFEFNNLELIEISPGVFEGQDENGAQEIHKGHKIHTEKIRKNWYYYIQYWY